MTQGQSSFFNERIFAARYVKKVHASNIQGFGAFGFGYLGIIDNDQVFLYQKPVEHESYLIKRAMPSVYIVKCYLEADGLFIDAAREAGANGIVLEGVGRGQVAPRMMPAIERALAADIPIVISTSAEEGNVYTTYDYEGSTYDLYKKGSHSRKRLRQQKSAHEIGSLNCCRGRNLPNQF